MIKDILIPIGTLLFGIIGTLVFTMFTAKAEARRYTLDTLREAFRDDKNDKLSRIDAYHEYKSLGGKNYSTYLSQLIKLPDDI